uniref:Uncharacterized protein n=1 Tax=Kalanchoe fedtschenkoi TaxID=63787 RepID=A0A7N0V959_KALFE
MQMFRPSNECFEQSYNQQSSIKPFAKPAGYGGSNLTQCQTQTQCFEAQLPGYGMPHHAAAGGYGITQHAAGAQGYSSTFLPKPLGHQHSQHGSYGSGQHGGYDSCLHVSPHANMGHQHGSFASGHQGAYGNAHHGSFAPSGAYSYNMKKREKKTWRRRSGNDSDSSGSDESDNDKC